MVRSDPHSSGTQGNSALGLLAKSVGMPPILNISPYPMGHGVGKYINKCLES